MHWRAALFTGVAALVACGELRLGGIGGSPSFEGSDAADDGTLPSATSADGAPSEAGHDAAPVCDGSCPPELLIDDLHGVTALTVDATNIYFAVESGNGTVYQCPKTGCASAPVVLASSFTTSIAVASGKVYWADFVGGTVLSSPIGGSGNPPTTVVSNQALIKGVVGDTTHLFWATNGLIKRCPHATCSAATTQEIVTGDGYIAAIAARNGQFAWAHNPTRTVLACASGPCPAPTLLGTGDHSVAIDQANAYWVNSKTKTVVKCALGGCAQAPLTIGSSSAPSHLVSDGAHVYWRDDLLDQICRCPVTGCASDREILATDQRGMGELAFDAEYVYWTTAKAVQRLRK